MWPGVQNITAVQQRISVTTDSQALHQSRCSAGRQPNLVNLCTVKKQLN
jgi:hypothetical protein